MSLKMRLYLVWTVYALCVLWSFFYLSYSRAESPGAKRDARPVKIAILDTGYDSRLARPALKLCSEGHYDYVTRKPGIVKPDSPHGTFVANIIASELEGYNYCAIVYRVYDEKSSVDTLIARSMEAYAAAASRGVIGLNYSLQGFAHSYKERAALIKLGKQKIKMFAGAGNDNLDLDKQCLSYPSCYLLPNVIPVGASSDSDPQSKASYSNYGSRVSVWFSGSYNDRFMGIYERGTSFAAPRALSDYVRSVAAPVEK